MGQGQEEGECPQGTVAHESRFERVDRRFDTLKGRVIKIDNRLTRVEERMGIR